MDHRFSGFLRRLSIILFWIVLWQTAASLIRNHIFLVGPVDTLRALCEQIVLPDFWSAIAFSFWRISIGFFLAFFLGLFTGSLAYRFPIVVFGTYSRIGRSVHGPYIGADGNGGAVNDIVCRHPVVRHKKAWPWQIPRHVLQAICVPVPDPDPRTVYATAFHGIATLRQYLRRRACGGNAV